MASSLVFVLINSTLLRYGGDLAVGAFGIINSVFIFVIMIVIGLNQGTQPIVGFNYGAKQFDRMFQTLKISMIIATILTILGFIVGMFFSETMVSMFTRDEELIAISANALRITVIMFPLVGSQIVISNFFQSIGKAKVSIALSLTRQFIFLIPCILILPPLFELNGAWAALPASDGLSAIISIITIGYYIRKFNKSDRSSF